MKIYLPYNFLNWNEYINVERANKYHANNIKQEEKRLVGWATKNNPYNGEYPIEIVFKPHFKDKRQDLDNYRMKGILDGLVAFGVIKNDNLKHVQRIVLEPIFDQKNGVDIEINVLNSQM